MAGTVYTRDGLSPQEYYASLGGDRTWEGSLKDKFHDIDDKIHFNEYMGRLQHPHTENFVLDFGNEDAWCATNLKKDELTLLLSRPRAKCFGTRWVNIWSPEEQKDTIKAITTYYGVSERLQGMMCTEPVPRTRVPSEDPEKQHSHSRDSVPPREPALDDIENAYALKEISESNTIPEEFPFKNLTFAHIVNQIWHFSSVDHGPRYTCIGYNTLFVGPNVPKAELDNGETLPEGQRIWTWLILTDDGTVISIQENPFPRQPGPLTDGQQKILDIVRRNFLNIFSGVSKQHASVSENDSLVTIRVRHFSDVGPEQANIKQEDGPSLLLYYIFDDWVSSYGLIAKREHQYGQVLEELRILMLEKPHVDWVKQLHRLGRRLAVLKRLYQSYELIMRRLLQRQRVLRDEARSSHAPPLSFSPTTVDLEYPDMRMRQGSLVTNGSLPVTTTDKPVGVMLASAAVARFERLVDRINLYCLSEIEACLTEKESLTFMNFNLCALKDSQAVEKLTRITILLAKATILFLPVSLMTAYFSTELKGVKGGYTKADYWVSFGVILFVSIVALALFGVVSGTAEGKTIYLSLNKFVYHTVLNRAQGVLRRKG